MPLPRRALIVLALLLILPAAVYAVLSTGDTTDPARAQAAPTVTSDNIEALKTVPGTSAISGVFSRTAPYFYVSGLNAVTVIDVSNPRDPEEVGRLENALFENEAMTMGERVGPDGKIQRFVLLGVDLVQAAPGQIDRGLNVDDGAELVVVDVTDPEKPTIIGRSGPNEITQSTHTVACVNPACTIVYTSGGRKFSIVDLTDLTKPEQIKEVDSPANGHNPGFGPAEQLPIFIREAGHHWQIDGAGVAWHTGSGGTAAFDISDPLNPQPLNGTDANGTKTPYNDFIHHNSQRPNAAAFREGRPPSVANGNVALVTEEDYADEGDELDCSKAGTFQTWTVPTLDGGAYRAANPKLEPNKGTMRVLDAYNAPLEGKGGASTPAGGFCSAHWFDYHQSGVIAEGFYQQGLRLINVRDAKDLSQYGYVTGGATEVWDAYWVPQRREDGTVRPGYKTNIVYTVDAVRGVEAFEVTNLPPDLPVTGDEGGRGGFPEVAGSGSAGESAGPAGSRCGAPASRFSKGSRITRSGLMLKGRARGRGCRIKRVRVAIGRKVGSECRFLRANGRFGSKRSCLRTQYVSAKGRTRWTLNRKVRLPRGKYLVWSRAIDTRGTVERKYNRRNLLRGRLRGR